MRKLLLLFGLLTLNLGLALPAAACLDANGNPVVDKDGLEMDGPETNCASSVSESETALDASKDSDKTYLADIDEESGIVDVSVSPNNSFFAAGTDVTLRGDISGLALAAGNNVDLLGSAEYGLLAGNTIKISGEIKRDLFAAGQSVALTEDASVSRDVFLAGQTVTLSANLYGNVFVAAERLVLDGITIDGDLHADVAELVVTNKSSVSGTLFRPSGLNLPAEDKFSASKIKDTLSSSVTPSSSSFSFSGRLIFFLGRVLLSLILIALFVKLSLALSALDSSASAAKSLGLGLLLVLGLPLCAAFSMFTLVGLPLGLGLLLVWFAFSYLGASISGLALGSALWPLLKKILKQKTFTFKSPATLPALKYLLGAILIFGLSFVPVLGGLVTAVSLVFGFGYLSSTLFSLKSAQKKSVK